MSVLVWSLLLLPVLLALALVAHRDMTARGRQGDQYAALIVFLLPVGLLVWALDRRRSPKPDAP